MKRTVSYVLTMILFLIPTALAFDSLSVGSTGPDVATAQQRLIDLGYLEGKADGIFGMQTESAVKEFQSFVGLEQTGIIDVALFDLLISTVIDEQFEIINGVSFGMSFDEIREILKPLFNLTSDEDISDYDKSGDEPVTNGFSLFWNGSGTRRIPFLKIASYGCDAIVEFYFEDESLQSLTSVLFKYTVSESSALAETRKMIDDYSTVDDEITSLYGDSTMQSYDWESDASRSSYGINIAQAILDEEYSMSDVWTLANVIIRHNLYYTADDEVVHQVYISLPDDN